MGNAFSIHPAHAEPHAAGAVPVTVIVDGVGGAGALTYTYGVVAPLPIAQPSAPPVGSPAPAPAPRPTSNPSGSPNPLPSSRP